MKCPLEVITVFVWVNSMAPVLMFYVYDEHPNIGFVTLDNSIGAFVPGYSAVKPYSGSHSPRLQKFTNEHMIDSHFKLMKSPSRYSMPAMIERNIMSRAKDYSRVTEAPRVWQYQTQAKKQVNVQQAPLDKQDKSVNTNVKPVNNKPATAQSPKDGHTADPRKPEQNQQQDMNKKVSMIPPMRPQAVNVDYSSMKQRPRSDDEMFESKHSYMQMNMRKTQISEPQKQMQLDNNRQMSTPLVHGTQNNRPRGFTANVMEKTIHKTNGQNDHNVKVMARVIDDMSQQLQEKQQTKGEYRKRDTRTPDDIFDKLKRGPISDNMRKYIGKDKNLNKERTDRMAGKLEVARIGSREERLDTSDTPYALFYRMNPESLDQQEAFVLMGSVETGDTDNEFMKEKRLSNDEFTMKQATANKPRMNSNTLRIHKKMRNYSNSNLRNKNFS